MGDLIIKPESGGSIKLQNNAGTNALVSDNSGNITLGGTLDVTGATTLTGNITLSGTANALGTVTAGNIDALTDVKKIASGAFTATTTIDVQGCFTSDYKMYKLYLAGYSVGASIGSGNGYVEIGYLDSSNAHITDTYYTKYVQYYASDSNGAGGFHPDVWTSNESENIADQNDSQGFRIVNTWHQDSIDEGQMLEMTFMVPQEARRSHVLFNSTFGEPSYVGRLFGMGIQNNTAAKHGIRIATHSGVNFTAQGYWSVYGYKM